MANGKLSIAMLGHKRIPSREGGVEIVVEELSTRMVQLGHSVICYNRAGHHVSGKQFDRERSEYYKGVRLKSVPTIDFKGLAAMTASFFAAVRAAFSKCTVVHFHAEGPCAMLWFPKLLGKRCIATIHGLDHQRAKWGKLASTYIMLGEKCAVKYADEIIVLSERVKQYFWDTYGRTTRYIPNGVTQPEMQAPEWVQTMGLDKDGYILYLGRLVPEKGIHYLIEAYKQSTTDKKLVIAGGSSDTDTYLNELKELAQNDPRIVFTGFVHGKALQELFSNAYIYCLPSDLEGMPLSLLEAMSYGNCCLVSDIPECVEVVEDKAVTFARGDINDLKKKLQMLCEDERQVAAFKKTASDFISKKYNWDRVVEETLRLYRGV